MTVLALRSGGFVGSDLERYSPRRLVVLGPLSTIRWTFRAATCSIDLYWFAPPQLRRGPARAPCPWRHRLSVSVVGSFASRRHVFSVIGGYVADRMRRLVRGVLASSAAAPPSRRPSTTSSGDPANSSLRTRATKTRPTGSAARRRATNPRTCADAAAVAGLFDAAGFFPIDLGGLVPGGRLQQVGGPLPSHNLVSLRSDKPCSPGSAQTAAPGERTDRHAQALPRGNRDDWLPAGPTTGCWRIRRSARAG